MDAPAIQDAIIRRAERLDLHLTTHMFRRGWAIGSRRRGISDQSIITMAGWSDPRMLKHYTEQEAQELAIAEFAAADPTVVPDNVIRRRAPRPVARRSDAASKHLRQVKSA
jgi:hypothetical protein